MLRPLQRCLERDIYLSISVCALGMSFSICDKPCMEAHVVNELTEVLQLISIMFLAAISLLITHTGFVARNIPSKIQSLLRRVLINLHRPYKTYISVEECLVSLDIFAGELTWIAPHQTLHCKVPKPLVCAGVAWSARISSTTRIFQVCNSSLLVLYTVLN